MPLSFKPKGPRDQFNLGHALHDNTDKIHDKDDIFNWKRDVENVQERKKNCKSNTIREKKTSFH